MKLFACAATIIGLLSGGVDHISWLDQIQQHASPPQVDTSPHPSGQHGAHRDR